MGRERRGKGKGLILKAECIFFHFLKFLSRSAEALAPRTPPRAFPPRAERKRRRLRKSRCRRRPQRLGAGEVLGGALPSAIMMEEALQSLGAEQPELTTALSPVFGAARPERGGGEGRIGRRTDWLPRARLAAPGAWRV